MKKRKARKQKPWKGGGSAEREGGARVSLQTPLLPSPSRMGQEALKASMPLFSYVIQNNNKYKEHLIHMVIPQVSLNPQKLKFFLKNSLSGGGGA